MDSSRILDNLNVSRETVHALQVFSNDLQKWSKKINLVSSNTLDDSWSRHILDSAQLLNIMIGKPDRWCDLGSGGGLPGLVVAIILKEKAPNTRLVLIESDTRKAAFLKMAVNRHGLNARIVRDRIERAEPAQAEIVSARALAPLPQLLGLVKRHLSDTGVALLPKGRNFRAEVEQARASWHFDLDVCDSLIDSEAKILRVSQLKPKVKKT